ncbi:reverse transcriptase domain-containing protein [Tanacetum coccineum]
MSIRRIDPVNTPYSEAHETEGTDRVKNEHLYSAIANEIDEKKPKPKDLPSHLEYAYLHGFFQIPIAPEDQEKMRFTCPYGTFAYRRMSFGLCNAPATFQRCMTAIFHDIVEDFIEVFMDDFLFNIEIKDKKGSENLAADHLSRLENPHMEVLTEREIADEFPDEHLIVLRSKFKDDEPWYADFVIYIVGKVVPPNWTFEKRKRCVAGSETLEIRAHFHSGPIGGHHSASVTAKKVYQSGFYWPSVFKDANEYVCEVFDVWGLDFMGPFPDSRGNEYILVVVHYVSKWFEAQALPMNDACVVVKFLRGLFARFGVPKALISDRGTHFCNFQLEKALQNMLNELAESRDGAYENNRIYKEQTKKWHDSRLCGDKDFKVGDKVLHDNSRLKMYPGKLKSKLSSPNIVKRVYPYGAVEIIDRNGFSFKVNGQRLNKYYECNIDKEDDKVIEFENGVRLARTQILFTGLNMAYPGFGIRHIDFLYRPQRKEIDNVVGVSLIWILMCVVVRLESRRIYNTHSYS